LGGEGRAIQKKDAEKQPDKRGSSDDTPDAVLWRRHQGQFNRKERRERKGGGERKIRRCLAAQEPCCGRTSTSLASYKNGRNRPGQVERRDNKKDGSKEHFEKWTTSGETQGEKSSEDLGSGAPRGRWRTYREALMKKGAKLR